MSSPFPLLLTKFSS